MQFIIVNAHKNIFFFNSNICRFVFELQYYEIIINTLHKHVNFHVKTTCELKKLIYQYYSNEKFFNSSNAVPLCTLTIAVTLCSCLLVCYISMYAFK